MLSSAKKSVGHLLLRKVIECFFFCFVLFFQTHEQRTHSGRQEHRSVSGPDAGGPAAGAAGEPESR